MKLTKIEQVNEFLSIVDSCKGDVTLRSLDGDIFNLKSKLSQYIAIAALLGQHGDELELFCSDREDEGKFMQFLLRKSQYIINLYSKNCPDTSFSEISGQFLVDSMEFLFSITGQFYSSCSSLRFLR